MMLELLFAALPVLSFNGEPVKVEEMRVSAVPYNRFWNGVQRPLDQTKTAYFAAFDSKRGGELKLEDGQSRKIDGPGKYTFDVEGGRTQLHVFVDPPWRHRHVPDEIYFGPGEHFPGVIAPTNGQTVCIDRGAVVHGTIFIFNATNVTVTGRGILELSDLKRADPESAIHRYVKSLGLPEVERKDRPETDANMSCTAFVAYGCGNLKVEGITIRDAPRWTMQIRNNCQGVTIDNVKILGSWRYNNDGIDLCSSSRIHVKDCFIRTYDDNVVVRSPWLEAETEDCRDILVEDCTFWCDWGKTFTVCTADKDCTIENVVMRRCRVENAVHAVCDVVSHHGTKETVVRDVLFEDIEVVNRPDRLEPKLQRGDAPFVAEPAHDLYLAIVKTGELGRDLGNQKRGEMRNPSWYHIDYGNITFRNIRVTGEGKSPLKAYFGTKVPRHTIRNLSLERMPANLEMEVEPGSQIEWAKPLAPYRLEGVGELGFTLALGKPFQPSPVREISAAEMGSLSVATNAAGLVTLRWKGHPICGEGFTVTATVAPDGAYTFAYDGNTSGYDIEWISFPDLVVPRTDATRILYPVQTGMVRLPDWGKVVPGEEVAGCGPLFQGFKFVSVLNDGGDSVYLDLRGNAREHTTRFRFYEGFKPATVRVASQHLKPHGADTRRAYAMPYGGVLRTFRGDWFEASDIYRRWVWAQDWYMRAKARRNEKLRNIGLWLWNRGASDVVLPPVEKVLADSGVPMALDWYWWHENAYGMEGPYYWPPREPVERFTAAVRRMREKGIYSQVYVNGMLSDCDDPRYTEEYRREVRVKRDGSDDIWLFNPFLGRHSAWNCGEAPNFRRYHRGQAAKLAAAGLDAIYYDMIANDAAGGCWSPHHSHVRGGGTHMVEGYRRLISEIRAGAPGVDLSSEEETEAFLEDFDSLIVLYGDYERLGKGVAPAVEMPPIYSAIYHGAVCLYGSYAVIDNIQPWDEKWPEEKRRRHEKDWMAMFPDQFAVDFARPVTWGLQPTVHQLLMKHATEAKYAEEYRFVVDTAKFYHANRDLLYDGEMLEPGTLDCDRVKVDFLWRGVYAADNEYLVFTEPGLPAVMHSVWKAPDGRTAAVLVNWTREARNYDLKSPDVTASGVLPPRSWRRMEGGAVR